MNPRGDVDDMGFVEIVEVPLEQPKLGSQTIDGIPLHPRPPSQLNSPIKPFLLRLVIQELKTGSLTRRSRAKVNHHGAMIRSHSSLKSSLS
ncbi:hypothetical protein OIU84_000356 [Salix udensis]|uniref:Uncharacterized protein n=1 Tax=Salix udensis TaxID=889485 RepID=A0AAD6PMB3_9ROSI|nr:hypothetical protein OIU84_000356 [Salix udensis]